MSDTKRPFSIGHVLRTTAKHMRRSIDIGIRNTFARVEEFSDDKEKSEEIFKTLSVLHQMRKELDDFQSNNTKYFKGK